MSWCSYIPPVADKFDKLTLATLTVVTIVFSHTSKNVSEQNLLQLVKRVHRSPSRGNDSFSSQRGTAARYNSKSVNLVQKQPDHSMTVPLNCGGSHTVISPIQLCTSQQDRKHRIQTQVGIMTHPKRGDIMRVEKNNFKGSLNTPARRYTETKRPPISTKVSMGKTEDKAKYSLSHKSPAQVDFLSIPSPVIVSKMTLQPRATSKATTRWRQRGSIAVQDSKVTKG